MPEYKKILVAIDGSRYGDEAFRKAVVLAKQYKAKLFIIHVIDTLYFANLTALDGGQAVNQFSEVAEKMLTEYREKAEQDDVLEVETMVEYGAPKSVIVETAEAKVHPDLVIVGAIGHSAITRFFLGSVSAYVAHYAPCDVLIERTFMPEDE
ncbi:universal stress protein [Listeria sp. PSOL-1]|uniref:universal stress protein n=1 Tax=Listeria sp. PSOL-1 TaxID=1844999 RepID=UPI0013D61F48|nr:universal stress protein [Listeria sp. PSOL-1]